MKAALYEDVNPATGKSRLKCALCHKVAYDTEEVARAATERIADRVEMEAYRGRNCGHWHITRR